MVERLTLAYDGRRYAGWQRQTNALAVQQVVEEALAALFERSVRVHGAGRTDAGVHARGQVAHFAPPDRLPPKALVHATNHRLPSDIRVMAASRMPDGFHARKSAVGKLYSYRLYRGRVVPPTAAPWVMGVRRSLDLDRIRRAMTALPGRHDFAAFALAGGSHSRSERRIFAASVDGLSGPDSRQVELRFWGEGFLRGMVRSLVGTLIEIGLGERPVGDMSRLLRPGHDRSEAGPTAEARGLCLERVFYPPEADPLEAYEA
ncbi:MAG: tRNA pseudouridine(38-40) synthase TruA [Holophagales bacterium]|nr:tRNA pseudouridine(38-40) synthase TruA [Holophagales bacterium]